MGINWAGAARGLGEGLAEYGRVRVSDEVSKLREQRMAQYQQAAVADERAYQTERDTVSRQHQIGMQDDAQSHQSGLAKEQAAAAAIASAQKREQELADMDREERFKINFERYKGEVNPDGTQVTLDTGDNKFTEKLDGLDAENYVALRTAATSAGSTEATLSVLEQIGAASDTGKTQELLARAGQYLGTEAGASMQAYQAAVTPLILDQTSKLTGVISDKDMEVIKSSMPSFATDPRANKIILGIIRKGMADAKALYAEANEHLAAKEAAGEDITLRGWTPSMAMITAPSELGQSNLDAAENPVDVLSGFEKWKANR